MRARERRLGELRLPKEGWGSLEGLSRRAMGLQRLCRVESRGDLKCWRQRTILTECWRKRRGTRESVRGGLWAGVWSSWLTGSGLRGVRRGRRGALSAINRRSALWWLMKDGMALRGDGLEGWRVSRPLRSSSSRLWQDPPGLGRGVGVALVALLRAGDAGGGAAVVLVDVFGVAAAVVLSAAAL